MIIETETARIEKLNVGPLDNCVYVIECRSTGKGVIIDAADESAEILRAASGIGIQRILTTHGHSDHIGALDAVKSELDVPWAMHLDDVTIAGMTPDEPLTDKQEIGVGDLLIHVRSTPGHTPGSVSFILEDVAFTGDTLFPGGPGATRWDYSSFGQIIDSIERRLMPLPDTTLIYPGHGLPSTIGDERPSVDAWKARGW